MIKILHQIVKMKKDSKYRSFKRGDYGKVVEFHRDFPDNSFVRIRLKEPRGQFKVVSVNNEFYEV